jgi:hypothetical protein
VKGLISSFKESSESKEKRERRKEVGIGGGNPKQPVGKINVGQYYILGQKFQWT